MPRSSCRSCGRSPATEKLKPPSPSIARRLIGDIGRRVRVLMAEVDGTCVGYAIYLFTYRSCLARPTLYLEDLFVLPQCRRGKDQEPLL